MPIKKIIQISDVHIRRYERHEEYIEIFSKLIKEIKEKTKECSKDEIRIVVCGDIAHQKNNMSPELNVLLSSFLRLLNNIAKTIIFAGNHDFLVNNKDRMDCLTSIIEIANFDNVVFADKLLDYSSGYLEDNNICWGLFSSFDEFLPPPNLYEYKRNNPDKKIFGLFHGNVVGARTDIGKVMDSGIDANQFKDCDAVLAGHIHKRQEIKKNGVPIVYSGSLIQQDLGENVTGHGFIIWDVDTMTYENVDISNSYSMYKIQISSIDDIDNDTERLLNL